MGIALFFIVGLNQMDMQKTAVESPIMCFQDPLQQHGFQQYLNGSQQFSRKRKLDMDEISGSMMKKRWVTPETRAPSPHTIPVPTPSSTRKRRLFSATVDQTTISSVLNSAKKNRAIYSSAGTITHMPSTVPFTKFPDNLPHTFTIAPLNLPAFSQALIKYTPMERFWLGCIAAAVKSNAKSTWIVMPQSEGGQVFQLCLNNCSNGLDVEVHEVLQDQKTTSPLGCCTVEELVD